jgi:hypothetical protein
VIDVAARLGSRERQGVTDDRWGIGTHRVLRETHGIASAPLSDRLLGAGDDSTLTM